jgi:hypothetical protein
VQSQSVVHLVVGFGGLLYLAGFYLGMRHGPDTNGIMRGNIQIGWVMMALILILPIVDAVVTSSGLSRWFYYGAYAAVLIVALLLGFRVYRRSTAKPAGG